MGVRPSTTLEAEGTQTGEQTHQSASPMSTKSRAKSLAGRLSRLSGKKKGSKLATQGNLEKLKTPPASPNNQGQQKDKLLQQQQPQQTQGGEEDTEEQHPPKASTVILREINPDPEVGNALQAVPLFAHLNKFEREKLGGALEEQSWIAGQKVFKESDPGKHFFIIKEGRARVYKKNEKGKDIVLCELSNGDYFGEQSILTGGCRTATVEAIEYLSCYTLSVEKFHALFKQDRLDVKFARRRVAVSAEANTEHGLGSTQREEELAPLPVATDWCEGTRELLLEAIHQSLLFQNFEHDHREMVAQMMMLVEADDGAEIIRQGEEGDRFYVIEQGAVDVFQEQRGPSPIDHHEAGGSFGELALMYNAPRNATVRAAGHCKLRVLERVWFNRIVKQIGEQRLQQYSAWLKRVELLAPLTNSERIKIAEALDVVDYKADQVLFREGDEGDAMYIVVQGEVIICKRNAEDPTKEDVIARCRAGNYFGERALINNRGRAAGAFALTHSRLLRLDRYAFVLLLGPLEEVMRKRVESYTDQAIDKQPSWKPDQIRFEDLRVLGVLGKGSYGYVQLVKDQQGGGTYALKTVSKQRVVETRQKGHIFDEKNLMTQMDHPFLVRLHCTYKDRDRLYFLLQPALGGELFPILRKMRMFPEPQCRFYAGCVILAFEYLHTKNFVYRDLKPENLLLDSQGYLKVTDFGFCKKVKHKTWTMCGTPEYLAPEIIRSMGHGKGVDWWTVGIFLFEMLASYTPFYGRGDDLAMYDRICKGKFKFPSHFQKESKSLIKGLLQPRPTSRLGVVKGGASKIKNHPFFRGFDWQALLWKKLAAPMSTTVADIEDTSNFNQAVKPLNVKPYVDDGTGWDKSF